MFSCLREANGDLGWGWREASRLLWIEGVIYCFLKGSMLGGRGKEDGLLRFALIEYPVRKMDGSTREQLEHEIARKKLGGKRLG